MRPVTTSFDSSSDADWVRVAATRDADTADGWRDAIEAAGVDVEVRIEDPRDALPGTEAVPDLVLGSTFAFGVWIPRDERERAIHALIDAGWDGRHGSTNTPAPSSRTVVRGALLALAAAIVIVCLRVVLG